MDRASSLTACFIVGMYTGSSFGADASRGRIRMADSKSQRAGGRRLGRGLGALLETKPAAPIVIRTTQEAEAAADARAPSDEPRIYEEHKSESVEVAQTSGYQELAVSAIVPSPYQPRQSIDDGELEALAGSIRSKGVLQPVVVRELKPGTYELVAGERRWRASQLAGLERLPAIVRELSDDEAAVVALVENVQRTNLNPIERGEALRRLIERFDLTQKEAAEAVGLERSSVANLIRLTELEPDIKVMVSSGALTGGHARALLALTQSELRIGLATRAVRESLSVREVERLAASRAAAGDAAAEPVASRVSDKGGSKSADVLDLEDRLSKHLGARVDVKLRAKNRGELRISFDGLEGFDRLLEQLGFRSDDASL
ncbi:MAG: ParB/RepB/Spo0J family partition protein [Planctomycetota bacterium]